MEKRTRPEFLKSLSFYLYGRTQVPFLLARIFLIKKFLQVLFIYLYEHLKLLIFSPRLFLIWILGGDKFISGDFENEKRNYVIFNFKSLKLDENSNHKQRLEKIKINKEKFKKSRSVDVDNIILQKDGMLFWPYGKRLDTKKLSHEDQQKILELFKN